MTKTRILFSFLFLTSLGIVTWTLGTADSPVEADDAKPADNDIQPVDDDMQSETQNKKRYGVAEDVGAPRSHGVKMQRRSGHQQTIESEQ